MSLNPKVDLVITCKYSSYKIGNSYIWKDYGSNGKSGILVINEIPLEKSLSVSKATNICLKLSSYPGYEIPLMVKLYP